MGDQFICDEWYVSDEKAWFLSIWHNELFELDLKDRSVRYLNKVPEKDTSFRSYSRCVAHNEYVYCFPDVGKNIWRYNLQTGEWHCVKLDDFKNVRAELKVCAVERGIVYLFSEGLRSILTFDLIQEEVVDIKDTGINSEIRLGNKDIIDGRLYVPDLDKPDIYCVDYLSGNTIKYSVPNLHTGFWCLSRIADAFWLSGNDGVIYRWKIGDEIVKAYQFPAGFEYSFSENHSPVFRIIHQSGRKFFIPYCANMICFMESEDQHIKELPFDVMEKEKVYTYSDVYVDGNNKVFFNSNDKSGFYMLDTEILECKEIGFTFDTEGFDKFFDKNVGLECSLMSLKDLINGVNK